MARPLKPFVRGGGYYPSRRWTPLVYSGGYTTMHDEGEQPVPILKTAVGNPIHITDALARAVDELKVAFSPIQDLHGYDSPWPAGGGANKANLTGATAYNDGTYGMYVTVNEQAETITLAGTWDKSDQGTSGTWRFIVVPNVPNGLNLKAFETTTGSHVSSLYWDGSSQRIIIKLDGMIYGSAYTITFKIVAYEGETEPASWTPYSNICPISGWTGANVMQSGADTSDYTTTLIPFTVNGDTKTIYGGYFTIAEDGSVKLTATMASVDMGDLSWSYASDANRFLSEQITDAKPPASNADKANIICSTYPVYPVNTVLSMDKAMGMGTARSLSVKDSAYGTDATAFKTAMSGEQLVYEIATPVEYDLADITPLTLLQGENNIWSDMNGDLTLSYYADGNASDIEALNLLLGGRYVNNHTEDEPSDEEALQIIMGETR